MKNTKKIELDQRELQLQQKEQQLKETESRQKQEWDDLSQAKENLATRLMKKWHANANLYQAQIEQLNENRFGLGQNQKVK